MTINKIISFGKYKGLTVQQIYQGTNSINRELLVSYLKARLAHDDLSENDTDFILDMMNFEIEESEIRATPVLDDFKGDHSRSIESLFKDTKGILGNLLLANVSLDEQNAKHFINNEDDRLVTTANPSYIEWCIKNLNHFFLIPSALGALMDLDTYNFVGIEVKLISGNRYEFKEIISTKKFTFKEETIRLNQNKYDTDSNNPKFVGLN